MTQLSLERQGTQMAIGTIPELDVERPVFDPPEETAPSSFTADEIDTTAFRLWQRASDFIKIADDCACCKGEAQQCYAACR